MQNSKENILENALSKCSTNMYTLVEELCNCVDYFLRLSGFPDLFGKLILVTFPYLNLELSFLQEQCE